MKYLLLIYSNGQPMSEQEQEHCRAEACEFAHELQAKGQYLAAAPLQPPDIATCVRVRDGKKFVTDGPFAETREHLAGFFMVDAKDLDEATAIAGRLPPAKRGTVEIRPILEIQGLPKA
jgi:hypothetical protein